MPKPAPLAREVDVMAVTTPLPSSATPLSLVMMATDTSAAAGALASIAALTCAAVEVIELPPLVASETVIAGPSTANCEIALNKVGAEHP